MASDFLDANQIEYFDGTRRRIKDTYELGVAQNNNALEGLLAQNRDNTRNQARQYDQMRDQLLWRNAQRGMSNSGVGAGLWGGFLTDRTAAEDQLQRRFLEQKGTYDLANQQLGITFAHANDDLDKQQTALSKTAQLLRTNL